MKGDIEHLRVLITVTTYPHPNLSHDEVVCTAGVTDEGKWIRLFPINLRHLPVGQRFHKYQWIELDVSSDGYKNDRRKESRVPDHDSIRLVGEPLPTTDKWRMRREIIDRLPHHTVSQLIELYDKEQVSLGVVKPKRVVDLEVTRTDGDWDPKYQQIYSQMRLFGKPPRPLRKIPFEFRYVFECEDDDKPRRALITDWELGALYLRQEALLGSDKAAESVKNRFLGDICREDKDTRFFMGTVFPHNTWIVVGIFWPPEIGEQQARLF